MPLRFKLVSCLQDCWSDSGRHGDSLYAGICVHAAVRIRPTNPHDAATIPPRWQKNIVAPLSSNSLQVEGSSGPPPTGEGSGPASSHANQKRQAFTFDRVLGPQHGQDDVYTSVQPLLSRFLDGYNVTVLAYGQTSSGKSYTMGTSLGDVDFEALVNGERPDPQVGIIPRAVAEIFNSLQSKESSTHRATAKTSFIEIYNEELIDLLADHDDENRPLVQIREDKHGKILWSGLREKTVNSVTDVMNLLLQGSLARRTNETEMNAQSSRSHAVFSLTLTQQKYVGSGPAPPPSAFNQGHAGYGGRTTPTGRSTPTGGRSTPSSGRMSGLPRPASLLPQVNRSFTPSGLPTSGRASIGGGSRPASVMGTPRSSTSAPNAGQNDGDWVTITSKFHFVDLAGSERLKRTAAQGERAKEGISINAGLHALGNVISALGDPAKAKKTIHIPYRDSKLTRLLQDSLGGNAFTMMIACVAPTEYNVGETVNTLQYANRARNIKNKAERNEVEVGWDDLEHLQSTVTRLRKQLAVMRASKGGIADAGALAALDSEVMQWQGKYTEASQRVSQLTAELTKLQQSTKGGLAQRGSTAGADDAAFLAAAEPIIVEYEKTLDALEGQANLMKAALSHSEDIIGEQEEQIARQDDRINNVEHQLETRETVITELQTRLAKLQDRESTADSYARDLEARLLASTNKDDTESRVMAELRKEVARMREAETSREAYIKEVETKLAHSSESTAKLQALIERLEADVARRDESYQELQKRVELLDTTPENKAVAADLQRSEQAILDLQAEFEALRAERDAVVKERGQLAEVVASHELQRGELQDRVRELESTTAAGSVASKSAVQDDLPGIAQSNGHIETVNEEDSQLAVLRAELEETRQRETEAKSQLEVMNAKQLQTMNELHELNVQLTEAQLTSRIAVSPQPEEAQEVLQDISGAEQGEEQSKRPSISSRRQSLTLRTNAAERDGSPERSPKARARRLSHRRSSGSLFGYNPQQGRLDSPSRRERPRSLSQQSLSQELLLASPASQRAMAWSVNSPFSPGAATPGGTNNAGSTGSGKGVVGPTVANYERKVSALEKGILSLQEALKKRDAELAELEAKLKQQHSESDRQGGATAVGQSTQEEDLSEKQDLVEAKSDVVAHAELPPPDSAFDANTPSTLDDVSSTAGQGNAETDGTQPASRRQDVDQHAEDVDRVNALIRSMAQKDEQHAREMDSLSTQLLQVQEQRNSDEDGWRQKLDEVKAELQRAHAVPQNDLTESQMAQEIAPSEDTSSTVLHNLPTELVTAQQQLRERETVFETQLQALRAEHSELLSKLHQERDDAQAAALSQLSEEHENHVAKLVAEHQAVLDSAAAEHVEKLRVCSLDHEAALAESSAKLQDLQSRHEAAVVAIQRDHAAEVGKLRDEHATALASQKAELENVHETAVVEYEAKIKEAVQKHSLAEQQLRQARLSQLSEQAAKVVNEDGGSPHDGMISHKEHEQTIADVQLRADGARQQALADAHGAFSKVRQQLLDEHVHEIDQLRREHEDKMAKLAKRLSTFRDVHGNMVDVDGLRLELAETSDALVTLEDALTSVTSERDEIASELEAIRSGEGDARTQLELLRKELDSYKASLANVKTELARSQREVEMLRDQPGSALRVRDSSAAQLPSSLIDDDLRSPTSPTPATNGSSRKSAPPPLTPPPSVPVPPTPHQPGQQRGASLGGRASLSSLLTRSESPNAGGASTAGGVSGASGSLTRQSSAASMHTQSNSIGGMTNQDAKKLLVDQSEELKNLARQLSHCEADLRANIDLVTTLEAALNDSERNLRKSRVQLGEVTRERDRYVTQSNDLRQQLQTAQSEVDSVRNSTLLEKQDFEQKIRQERAAKEKAARDLEARMEEINRKKSSKLFCI